MTYVVQYVEKESEFTSKLDNAMKRKQQEQRERDITYSNEAPTKFEHIRDSMTKVRKVYIEVREAYGETEEATYCMIGELTSCIQCYHIRNRRKRANVCWHIHQEATCYKRFVSEVE